uniref:Secreted Hemocyanin-like protein n=1 Tax=Pristhesancus plagipennis TaxID=1955184 RepID=A0A2K8JSH6_PRIPG|nr:secreted Hemocyanin-like protein [Pristhesancus plagipennis]
MKLLILCVALFQSLLGLVVLINAERIQADKNFVLQQKQVIDLFAGVGQNINFENEYSNYNIAANLDKFERPELIQEFLRAHQHGFLPPHDGIFSMADPLTRRDTRKLFDLFFFAKDFQTFYKSACWARKHVNEKQFTYTYILALLHRKDCGNFAIPPLYEILPTYFVPTETMHQVFRAKMLGVKDGKFTYNSTGYEYNYHPSMFGGPLSFDATGNIEYKVSYIREDVGLNNFYAMFLAKLPSWMCPERYGGRVWYKRGETFYFAHQQLFARYTLERLANGVPYVERLEWNKPIKVGYNPRVSHWNGKPLYTRPDYTVIHQNTIFKVDELEKRILTVIDKGLVRNMSDTEVLNLSDDKGIELLGNIIYGTTERPNRDYFPSYYWDAIDTLGYTVHTANENQFVGEAISTPLTTFRDPAFYQFLNRLLMFFQRHKRHLRPYLEKDLSFPGVSVADFEADKLITYFDMFEYDITNGVPMNSAEDYVHYRYTARQYRLNHKPYTYKIKINSKTEQDAVVRVFIGPKYDSQGRLLTLVQRRWAFFQIDRFPAKLTAGETILERSSTASHIFTSDSEGFRSIYTRIVNSLNKSEPFYIKERNSCGYPIRYQLPKGCKNGQPFVISVVVTPQTVQELPEDKKKFYSPCGLARIYDTKTMGFPFDRSIDEEKFDQPNIFFKDILIYHKEDSEINRSSE